MTTPEDVASVLGQLPSDVGYVAVQNSPLMEAGVMAMTVIAAMRSTHPDGFPVPYSVFYKAGYYSMTWQFTDEGGENSIEATLAVDASGHKCLNLRAWPAGKEGLLEKEIMYVHAINTSVDDDDMTESLGDIPGVVTRLLNAAIAGNTEGDETPFWVIEGSHGGES